MKTYEKVAEALQTDGVRFWSNDNIADYVDDYTKQKLIDEAEEAAAHFLRALLIDIDTDPNAKGTARRLAKMYYNELFSGRYDQEPEVTAFPNEGEDAYDGMLVVRSEIKSICSHHHQPVVGLCLIAILPDKEVAGLSKYTRLAQWHARRGTLQEELCQRIRKSIASKIGTENVAVYIEAQHGCCTNRGIEATNSLTQTSSLGGEFKHNIKTKEEFLHYIQMQKM